MQSIRIIIVLGLCTLSQSLFAHCTHSDVYAGAGVTFNSLSGTQFDDAAGFQFFGGYCSKFNFNKPKIGTSLEGGYMNSGDFERTTTRFEHEGDRPNRTLTETRSFSGAWLSGLGEYRLSPKLHLMGRLGLDVGDDNGLIFGGGAAINITKAIQLRGEYVIRDTIDSVQINLLTEF